jgi:hypothetical protein
MPVTALHTIPHKMRSLTTLAVHLLALKSREITLEFPIRNPVLKAVCKSLNTIHM